MKDNTNGQFVGFQQIKQLIPIKLVLERYGLLQNMHGNGDNLNGVCPLHQGHNPAQFRVSLSKNCWICFGDCNGGGSIIDFVSRKEQIGIREAALLLQDWFSLGHEGQNGPVPIQYEPQAIAKTQRSGEAKAINSPLRFSLDTLDGNHAYLAQRGLCPETINTFGLGFCRNGSLRGWIAIPIHDEQGRLVAYAARWPGEPKPGMPRYRLPRGFRKSLEIFNQHRAANSDGDEPLVITEGYFGCMRVWQAGYHRVVSIMGSRLSQAQEWRIAEIAGRGGQVSLLFDEDTAGRKGRAEAAERLSKSLVVNIICLTDGQQPDSLPTETLRMLLERRRNEQEAA
jgi:DNA primase